MAHSQTNNVLVYVRMYAVTVVSLEDKELTTDLAHDIQFVIVIRVRKYEC